MAFNTLLISQVDLQAATAVSANLDPRWWRGYIDVAQEDFLRPAIGQAYLNQLRDQTEANTLTPENENALQYLRPALAFAVLHLAIYDMYARVENKGLMVNGDATSTPASVAMLEQQRLAWRRSAETLLRRAQEFLAAAPADYPLYAPTRPATTAPNIYLPNPPKQCK